MNTNEFLKFYDNYHKGSNTTLIRETNKNGYVKETKMAVRFIDHYNTKEFKASGKTPRQPSANETAIIPHVLKYNANTGNTLLVAHTCSNSKARPSSKYFFNGKEISKEEYYNGIGEEPKTYNTNTFTFTLDTIKSIG